MNRALSVSVLVRYLKDLLDQDRNIQNILVEGEISNFRRSQSGHLYFTLKDERAAVSCIMYRYAAQRLLFRPKDGDQVLLKGSVSLYEDSGSLQLYVQQMRPNGLGDLFLRYEKLRAELAEKGLFAQEHKQQRPSYPMNIAVLTGEKSAAMSDIRTCFARRWPLAKVDYYPIPVQGKQAPAEIVAQLKAVDPLGYDAIILARGGGSFEDLFCFNDEELAYTIYHLQTFLISGIGHEQDFTIADFTADLRAPTPTAAVELLTPNITDELQKVRKLQKEAENSLRTRLFRQEERLEHLLQNKALSDGKSLLRAPRQRIEFLQGKLYNVSRREAARSQQIRWQLSQMETALHNRKRQSEQQLSVLTKRQDSSLQHLLQQEKQLLKRYEALVSAYSREKIFSRGYALVYEEGKLIKSTEQVAEGALLDICFADGKLKAAVQEVFHGKKDI
ncbi:MAG: exodeoxyribonuclease VII large subunit [Erysipelotrichaceae bacterium]|nr:exodeoxyribonuclease VII large subunit [Erysipelotrichaceae bacterium]